MPEADILAQVQLNIAQRWRRRAIASVDVFAQFLFYFAAFNALYFLWRKVDESPGSESSRDDKWISHLLSHATVEQSNAALLTMADSVSYFLERHPVQRMDRRSTNQPFVGDAAEGRKWQRRMSSSKPNEQLVAMAEILFLVRSNLVHGSKQESGDDRLVIEQSIGAAAAIVDVAIELTERRFGVTGEDLNDLVWGRT